MPINYNRFTFAENGKTLLTGIRRIKHSSDYYISGWYQSSTAIVSFVYRGPLEGCGRFYDLSFPSAPGATVTSTNLYGPNEVLPGLIQVVGNYTIAEQTGGIGCFYQGLLDGSGSWSPLIPTPLTTEPILNTIAHSTHGGIVVGNFDTELTRGRAFLYDIAADTYLEIKYDSVQSVTAYGVWHNGGNSYTICGGFFSLGHPEQAYLLDWNRESKEFSNFRTYTYKNKRAMITHFNGISGSGDGYTLTGDTGSINVTEPAIDTKAFFATVRGKQSKATWRRLAFPHAEATSGNSVAGHSVIGVYLASLSLANGQARGYTAHIC